MLYLADLLSLSATTWTALAAWTTTAIAGTAVWIARSQLAEAQRLRAEQAQPYVAVFVEGMRDNPRWAELVVKNFGATSATNVKLAFEQHPRQTRSPDELDEPESGEMTSVELALSDLPLLVPGQEWRTFWDDVERREQARLPNRHSVIVTFDDRKHGIPPTHVCSRPRSLAQ